MPGLHPNDGTQGDYRHADDGRVPVEEGAPQGGMGPNFSAFPAPIMIQRFSAHEVVVATLRDWILTGTLHGGTRLIQSEVAAKLGVSTTPVREAMRDLAAEGLLRLDAYRGAVVRESSLEEALEVYELRMILEPLAIRKSVARITDEQLAEVERIRALAAEQRDPGAFFSLNRELHEQLIAPAASTRLLSILTNLRNAAAIHVGVSILMHPEQMERGDRDHQALMEAYRSRDAEAAVAINERHLKSSLQAIHRAETRS